MTARTCAGCGEPEFGPSGMPLLDGLCFACIAAGRQVMDRAEAEQGRENAELEAALAANLEDDLADAETAAEAESRR